MTTLEKITVGSLVSGIASDDTVSVVATKWYGNGVLEITYRDSKGIAENQLLYREDEGRIDVVDANLPWSFDADANELRLTSEAYRINLAHLFDPYLAVHASAIEPLPHQISAVYQDMLKKLPLRFILADDPGAGKTIMTGLLIREMIARGDLKRCLVVCPGSLAEQWQDELFSKFSLRFKILTNEMLESAVTGNAFLETNLCIARLDKLSRNESVQEKLKATEWDLIVVDEAHKMSATSFGDEVKHTKRFKLGRLLSNTTRHFLLLTATPHNGKEKDYQLFLSLVDQDRFEGVARNAQRSVNVSDIMRRLIKEELLKFDGTRLFPERRAYTINYELSLLEAELYRDVTCYVQKEFNRADNLNSDRKSSIGFALMSLQRRLASSPEAILQSIKRRRQKLETRLEEERLVKRLQEVNSFDIYDDDFDEDDFTLEEFELAEEEFTSQSSAAANIAELEAEINTLRKLEALASRVRASGEDRKWNELSKLLQDESKMFSDDGMCEKLIIFTEYRDTLNYLAGRIRSLLGDEDSVVVIHGGVMRDERRKIEERFRQDKNVRILLANDAAGEGINLQRSHLMVNYDLPWNPNRLEQRFGRIHRIGQTEVCHLWNLVSQDTREGQVFKRLFEKLEQERVSLGGKVFDILGQVNFSGEALRDLLMKAIRYGNDPEVRERLNEVVDKALDRECLEKLLKEYALTEDVMDVKKVSAIHEDLLRMETHKLQPHFIKAFFIEAFRNLGGKIREREKERFEISFVPYTIRSRDSQIGFGVPMLSRYDRICFDKEYANTQGQTPAELISPGHPLLEAVCDIIRERGSDALKRGAIFIDDTDFGHEPRLLFYVENQIRDGTILPTGSKRVVSKKLHFVEIKENGDRVDAGYAPYLDYRPMNENEVDVVKKYIDKQVWLSSDIESLAREFAVTKLIPEHLREVKSRRLAMIDKTIKAVRERLTAEIQYWDFRAAELKQKEEAGKTGAKLNAENASRRAEELQARLTRRLEELDRERALSSAPPLIIGGALVIPKGLLGEFAASTSGAPPLGGADKKSIENAAMDAVMKIERSLDFTPLDVSGRKCGYDIESGQPNDLSEIAPALRFIEVKGRAKGATTVTVTVNEIRAALNSPDEFILAIVEVDGDITQTTYLKRPFSAAPDFSVTSVNYNIDELVNSSEVELRRYL
jgi:SNF2 family DNA or RNA helicase